MAGHRIGESGGPSSHHQIPYGVLQGIYPPTTSFMNQEGSAFDFGELEEAIVLQGVKINSNHDDAKTSLYATRPAATLEMFPSWPMRFHHNPPRGSSKSGGEESTDSGSAVNTLSTSKADHHHHPHQHHHQQSHQQQLEPESPISRKASSSDHLHRHHHHHQGFDQKHLQMLPTNYHHHHHQEEEEEPDMASTDDHGMTRTTATTAAAALSQPQLTTPPAAKHTLEKRRGPGSSTSEKALDAKTLRRLAQNREAARKSRLRKKAYVQQLESSRIKLTQLEQDLQRARSQGLFVGAGGAAASGNISSGAAIFDMEYARWLDDDHRHMSELRTGLQAHLSDGDLRLIVDGYVAHYDEVFRLKGMAAKSDIFHLITGMWTTPAERCFLWMGGFRPSELIKMLVGQLDPLTEQQLMGIYSLQHSSQQAEEALSQGLEQLHQSLVDTVAGGSVNDGMHHMAVALGKLANLEGFVRQADNLRQQTLHQLCRILTVRQAARCFLVIGEYYGRLRALSSLWASRPRETLMSDENSCQTTTDLQMVQSSQNHHFPSF